MDEPVFSALLQRGIQLHRRLQISFAANQHEADAQARKTRDVSRLVVVEDLQQRIHDRLKTTR